MCMLDEIRAKRDEIYAIARAHKAEKLWVFVSCVSKNQRLDEHSQRGAFCELEALGRRGDLL